MAIAESSTTERYCRDKQWVVMLETRMIQTFSLDFRRVETVAMANRQSPGSLCAPNCLEFDTLKKWNELQLGPLLDHWMLIGLESWESNTRDGCLFTCYNDWYNIDMIIWWYDHIWFYGKINTFAISNCGVAGVLRLFPAFLFFCGEISTVQARSAKIASDFVEKMKTT